MLDLPVAGPLDVGDALLVERQALLELLANLDDAAWRSPTECPAWSVHGVALHLLGDDLSLLSRQRDAATNGLVLYAETRAGLDIPGLLNGFNEQWVTAAGFLSPALVVELLRLTGTWTHRYYADTDPDQPGEPVWFFGGTTTSPVWQAAAREYVERWVHHHQVLRAIGAPALDVEFHRPCAAAVARALAAQIPALAVPPDTSAAFAIEGVGEWTIARSDDGWLTYDGAVANPDAAVRWTAEEAVEAMSTTGFPTDRAKSLITAALQSSTEAT